jgi:hypothetical protein
LPGEPHHAAPPVMECSSPWRSEERAVPLRDTWTAPRLVRPFLGVGAAGGFTTFSTFAVESQLLALERAPGEALLYVVVTPALAMAAVTAGVALARRVTRPHVPHTADEGGRSP